MHATLQTLVGLFIILGLVFIEDFKSLSHEAHFFSLHSWVGIISIAIYFGQYLSGTLPKLPLCFVLTTIPAGPAVSFAMRMLM